jgi:hypothetical protein
MSNIKQQPQNAPKGRKTFYTTIADDNKMAQSVVRYDN